MATPAAGSRGRKARAVKPEDSTRVSLTPDDWTDAAASVLSRGVTAPQREERDRFVEQLVQRRLAD